MISARAEAYRAALSDVAMLAAIRDIASPELDSLIALLTEQSNERSQRSPSWSEFLDEFLNAIDSDDIIDAAISTWAASDKRDQRARWSVTLWMCGTLACRKAEVALADKVPPP